MDQKLICLSLFLCGSKPICNDTYIEPGNLYVREKMCKIEYIIQNTNAHIEYCIQ